MAMSLETIILKLNHELQGQKLLVAVSGGVDSMVLLHALKNLSPIVIHINHHKREESIQDETLVSSFCIQEKLTYLVKHVDVKKGNFQAEAHALRQTIYLDLAHQFGVSTLLTAHHQDDHIETIIMRILKGSALEYQAGLNLKQTIDGIVFYKPFLSVKKQALYTYAEIYHVPFNEDISNQSNIYTRNKIRNELLPVLKSISPDYQTYLLHFSERARDVSNMIKNLAEPYLTEKLSRKKLLSIDPLLAQEVIRLWLIKHACTPSKVYVTRIYSELINEKPFLEILLENDRLIYFSYDEIFLTQQHVKTTKPEKLIQNNEILGHKDVSIFYDNKPNNNLPLIKICYNKLIFPLTIRYRKPGDLLHFHYGHKKLKDHLMNVKYPRHQRDSLIVIEDQSKTIIYVEDTYTNKTLGDTHKLWVNIRTHDER
jgi:bifunctional protein TilS/HprT